LGRAAALAFAKQGYNLVLAARRVERLNEVKIEVEQMGVKALVVPTDVTIPEHTQRLIDASIEHFGQVDLLINNAGVGLMGSFVETPMEEVRKLFDLNFFGAAEVMQAGLKTMERQGWGTVINVASTAGVLPSAYIPVYNATKAALVMLSESVNIEYIGTRIKVVAFCPGVIETDFYSSEKGIGRYKKWVKPMKPASAENVAEKIVQAALKPSPTVMLGRFSFVGRISKELIPQAYYAFVKQFRDRMQQENPPTGDS
jgi:short-subunit dehydrogenase